MRFDESVQFSNDFMNNFVILPQTPQSNIERSTQATVTTEEVTLPYLVDKFADIVQKNEGVGLIIASGIATSIIIYVIAKAATEIITALHRKS